VARARAASRTGDISDADVLVYEQQRTVEIGDVTWPKIDTDCALPELIDSALMLIAEGVRTD